MLTWYSLCVGFFSGCSGFTLHQKQTGQVQPHRWLERLRTGPPPAALASKFHCSVCIKTIKSRPFLFCETRDVPPPLIPLCQTSVGDEVITAHMMFEHSLHRQNLKPDSCSCGHLPQLVKLVVNAHGLDGWLSAARVARLCPGLSSHYRLFLNLNCKCKNTMKL